MENVMSDYQVMKKSFLSILLSLFVFTGFSEELKLHKQKSNFILDCGYQIGIRYHSSDRLKINSFYSFNLSPKFSLGLGTGTRYYHKVDEFFVPLYLDSRFDFSNEGTTMPFISMDLGYSFHPNEGKMDKVGVLFNVAVGCGKQLSDNLRINLSIDYEGQSTIESSVINYTAETIGFNIGLVFY